MRAFVSWLLGDPMHKAQLHEPQGPLWDDWEGWHRNQPLRGIKGCSSHFPWPSVQGRVTVNRKETIVWKNCLKYFSCSVEALFVVWRALVTVWSCCTNSEYIYCNVVSFLSQRTCIKTVEECWQTGVCKESTGLDISLLHNLCSVGNVNVDKGQC